MLEHQAKKLALEKINKEKEKTLEQRRLDAITSENTEVMKDFKLKSLNYYIGECERLKKALEKAQIDTDAHKNETLLAEKMTKAVTISNV